MVGCDICGINSPMLIKGEDGLKRCSGCFVIESPIIDEGWRILKDAMDNNMEWEDTHAIERGRLSNRSRRN